MHRFLSGEVPYLFRDESEKWCFCRCCFPVAILMGMKGVELTHPRSKAIRSVASLRHVDGSILALGQWKSRRTTDSKREPPICWVPGCIHCIHRANTEMVLWWRGTSGSQQTALLIKGMFRQEGHPLCLGMMSMEWSEREGTWRRVYLTQQEQQQQQQKQEQ